MKSNDIRYLTYYYTDYDKEKISDYLFKYNYYDLSFNMINIKTGTEGRITNNLFPYFFNIKLYDTWTYTDQTSGGPLESTDSFDYIQQSSINIISNLMTQTIPSQPPSSTIFNSNFRDKFISEYHIKVAQEKLLSVSDNSCRIISKDTYDFLYQSCNIKYALNVFDKTQKGFEGFIDDHTYITCTHNLKEDLYYLNTIFTHNADVVNNILDKIDFVEKPASVSWVTGVHSDGSLDVENLPIEEPKPIYDSFYPWLGEHSLDSFLDNYISSQESILLLYGFPGTGKSNLLKHLLHKYNQSALITYQDDIRDLDKMFSSFLKGEEKFLIIEDADEFLTKRESGNTSMKRLLNIADGLTSNKDKKVIFTSNITNLNNIDSALLRPGRCYDAVKFDSLTKEQAIKVSKDLELDLSLIVKSSYTLAELFAIKNNKLKLVQSNKKAVFGFNN